MSDTAPSDAVINAWVRLVRAQQGVLGAVEADLKRAGFPPLGWYDVLLELRHARDEGLRPLEIEGRLLLAQHNVSRLLDRMERAGYVERRPCVEDGRGQIVVATHAGHDLMRRMWPIYQAAIDKHVGAKLQSEAQAQTLARLLGRLIDGD
ncbi:MAG TPA: MarR family winged helix-turn-helix transcriptional regulator [Vineibacter sp.]|nr:MarR family winged helix-turn-helix transcriptional regulator [Vineibacter sp.]